MNTMQEIEKFVCVYEKDYRACCKEASEQVKEKLSKSLKQNGIKHLAIPREKDTERLLEKLQNRFKDEPNQIDDKKIFDEIVDIAGARIALYFPRDRMQVESLIYELFDNVEYVPHPKEDKPRRSPKRFEGYCADHYRVNSNIDLKINDDETYRLRVEIQVVSMLMHSWMEVEHDLIYKPGIEVLTYDEVAFLDTVNGLVIAGEVALEALEQRLMQRGVLPLPRGDQWAVPLLSNVRKKVLIVGQNLYTLLNDEFKKALFDKFENNLNLKVEIIVANPGQPLKYDPPFYYEHKFFEHLDESIKKLNLWKTKACGKYNLKIHVSNLVERETVFFADPESEDGLLMLKRVPLGSRPEARAQVKIEKKRHPKVFENMWRKYSGLCRLNLPRASL